MKKPTKPKSLARASGNHQSINSRIDRSALVAEAARIKAELEAPFDDHAIGEVRVGSPVAVDPPIWKNSGPMRPLRSAIAATSGQPRPTSPRIDPLEMARIAADIRAEIKANDLEDEEDEIDNAEAPQSRFVIEDEETGTVWAHPLVAVEFARWLSPEFDELAKDPTFLQRMLDEYLDGAPQRPESFADALMAKLLALKPAGD